MVPVQSASLTWVGLGLTSVEPRSFSVLRMHVYVSAGVDAAVPHDSVGQLAASLEYSYV